MYKLNQDFFEKINTEEKAYFLGFLYADGNVIIKEKKNYVASIEIQREDSYLLEKLRDLIFLEKRPLSYRKRNLKWKETAALHICNKKIAYDLIENGCFVKKSFLIRFPSLQVLPELLQPHFIRGYFDGDGGVYIKKNGKIRIHITSNINFCLDLKEKLKNLNIFSTVRIKKIKPPRKAIATIDISRIKDIFLFYNSIYLNSSVWCYRKRESLEKGLSKKKNPFQKYIIESPSGEVFETDNLILFARERGLCSYRLYNIAHNIKNFITHKGFKIRKISDNNFRESGRKIKKYKIEFPDGKQEIIENLSKFCKKNNLSYTCMIDVFRGKASNHKNYKIMNIDSSSVKFVSRKEERTKSSIKACEKRYKIYFQDGTNREIVNISQFCKQNNYNNSCLCQMMRGKRKYHKSIVKIENLGLESIRDDKPLSFNYWHLV